MTNKEFLLSLNTCTRPRLIELEQSTFVVQIKGSVRDSVWALKFDMKHPKKAEWHIGRNVVSITIKMSCPNILSNNNYSTSSQKFREIILGSCQGAEKVVEHEGESNTICSGCAWNSYKSWNWKSEDLVA